MLLDKGADVNARTRWQNRPSALRVAANKGHNRIIEILFENGADATGALQEATGKGHEKTVQILLEHGVDVNNAECEYGSALFVAVVVGNRRIAEALLERKADILAKGGCSVAVNALEGASRCGYDQLAELLSRKGAHLLTRAAESDAEQLHEWHRTRIADAFHRRRRELKPQTSDHHKSL